MNGFEGVELEQLCQIQLFQNLAEGEIKAVLNAGHTFRFDKGRYLFQQGDPADHLYVLLEGRVKLSQVTVNGYQIILRVLCPFQMFGGMAILPDRKYPVAAKALETSRVLFWRHDCLKELVCNNPQVALNAMSWVSEFMNETQEMLAEMVTEKVERRLAHLLLRLAHQIGKKTEEGVLVEVPLTRQDMAEMAGTRVYSVSRILCQWEKAGLLEAGRGRFLIRNPHALVTVAEEIKE